MILWCNYEEMQALKHGASAVLGLEDGYGCSASVSSEDAERVHALLPRLSGDLSIRTLAEAREVGSALETIVRCLEAAMKSVVVQSHPGDEGAVDAYFGFAHGFAVLSRAREMQGEMAAMIEVFTGVPVSAELERTFDFPD